MLGASSLPEFGDFDDENVYERCHRAAVRGDTKNFVIEFDSTKAHAAYDLNHVSIKQLLELEVNNLPTTFTRSSKIRDLCIFVNKNEG